MRLLLRRLPPALLLILILAATPALAHPLNQGGTIRYGETVDGTVSAEMGDSWTFSGRSGDTVRISMNGVGGFDTYLELLGPSGSSLITDDDSGAGLNSLIDGFVLTESGRYTIVARGFAGSTGSYTLTLERVGGANGNGEIDLLNSPVAKGIIIAVVAIALLFMALAGVALAILLARQRRAQ